MIALRTSWVLALGLLGASLYAFTRTVVAEGNLVCGSVHAMWRGSNSVPFDLPAPDSCVAPARTPVLLAQLTLVSGAVLLLVAVALLTRRVWQHRSPSWGQHVGAALAWGLLGAVTATVVAVYADPGPSCPSLTPGNYDDYLALVETGHHVSFCLVAGGGLEKVDLVVLAVLGGVAGLVLYPVVRSVTRRVRGRRGSVLSLA